MKTTQDIVNLAHVVARANSAAIVGWHQLANHWLSAAGKSIEESRVAVEKVAAAKSPVEAWEIQRSAAQETFIRLVSESAGASELVRSVASEVAMPLAKQFNHREQPHQAAAE